jgi:hypothetical protein
LSSTSNIITGTISCGNITGRTGTTVTAPTITASSNLFYGSTNVATKIATIETNINGKQPTLSSTSNIITGTISCGNITGITGTIVTAPTITASSNLFYGSTNVATKIATIETNINGKQPTLIAGNNITIDQTTNTISSTGGGGITTINDGDLTIAKTNGLKEALDSTAKLDSVNTFTGTQTIVGDLKAYNVSVKNTTPT